MKNTNQKARAWLKPVILIIFILMLFIAARMLGLGERIAGFQKWIESLGTTGIFVFILLYIIATVAAIPGSAITLAAGALFGSVLGVIVVSAASTAGAAVTFLISRYFARDSLVRWLSGNESFQKLDKLTGKHGAVIVALTRLVPVFPFNILNYGFGLTRVTLRDYVFWSWLCMLPGTLLYVIGADAVTTAIARKQIPWELLIILAVCIALLAVIVNSARKKLKAKERTEE